MSSPRIPKALLGLCVALAAPATAVAESSSPALRYLGVLGTYTVADDNRLAAIDYATGLQLIYGYKWADSPWGLEGHLFFDNYETRRTLRTDFYRSGLGIDLVHSFNGRLGLAPFALIGVGYAYNDVLPDVDDDYTWNANIGVGLLSAPLFGRESLRLRGELRYVYDDFSSGMDEFRLGLGLEFGLARTVALPPPVEPQVQVVEVSTGLLDSDGDGVVDERDRCPGTPPGTRVDGDGCPLPKILELKGVTFEFDRTRLRPDAETILAWAVELLQRYPDMRVQVAGHTDNIGSAAYNQRLSLARAEAVRDHFIAKGITADRFEVKGYGFDEPVVDNDTELNRERNRRVELRVLN